MQSGAAAERFGVMLAAMGGPADFVEGWAHQLPESPVIRAVPAAEPGIVQAIDGEALGLAVVALGGGRMVESDRVNPAVGVSDVVRLGQRVERGQPLAMVHAARSDDADRAVAAVGAAIMLGEADASTPALICAQVG